jgi:hypothetical protein
MDAGAGRGRGDVAAAGSGLGRPADRGRVRVQSRDGSSVSCGRGVSVARGNADVVRQDLTREKGTVVSLRNVDGWQTLATKPTDAVIDLAA